MKTSTGIKLAFLLLAAMIAAGGGILLLQEINAEPGDRRLKADINVGDDVINRALSSGSVPEAATITSLPQECFIPGKGYLLTRPAGQRGLTCRDYTGDMKAARECVEQWDNGLNPAGCPPVKTVEARK